MKVGGTCAGIFVARGLGGTAAVTPLLWRYGCRRGRMTGVISSQSVVPTPLLTMHGHVHHVDGASTMLGPPWLPVLPEGSTFPSGEAEIRRGGSGTFDDAAGAQARRRDIARDAYHARGLSARLGAR
jgi:hypothetical protein